MEEIRITAYALYENGSSESRAAVKDFFNSMDTDGSYSISKEEFTRFLDTKCHERYKDPRFFSLLDEDRNGSLDFKELLAFFYFTNFRGAACDVCRKFLFGLYFTCVRCLMDGKTTYDLCLNCFQRKNHHHEHTEFLDNYAMLNVLWKDKLWKGATGSSEVADDSVATGGSGKTDCSVATGGSGVTVACNICHNFLFGLYFTCARCFMDGKTTYDLCLNCFPKHHHEHTEFLYNFAIVGVTKKGATGSCEATGGGSSEATSGSGATDDSVATGGSVVTGGSGATDDSMATCGSGATGGSVATCGGGSKATGGSGATGGGGSEATGGSGATVACDVCHKFLVGLYFTCGRCFIDSKMRYNLCLNCFQNHHHEHTEFLDNYASGGDGSEKTTFDVIQALNTGIKITGAVAGVAGGAALCTIM